MIPVRRDRLSVRAWGLLSVWLAFSGCAGALERSTLSDLERTEELLAPLDVGDGQGSEGAEEAPASPVHFDGTLAAYQTYAFEHSPELRASFEAWRAATYRPQKARRVPEMVISYAGFIRSVETRVGPQRHKLGIQQWFPWPTKLSAAADSEALAARAYQRQFEAHALQIAAEVSAAFWRLWFVERSREIEVVELQLLRTLAEFVQVRVEASLADISDLTRINLRVSFAEDSIDSLDEEARIASAVLVRVVGAADGTATPVAKGEPMPALPAEDGATLRQAAAAHPRIEAVGLMSESADERARAERADRYPSIGVGVDWIITGEALDPTMMDSGKDAVVGMAAIKVPLSLGAYAAGENEAKARSRMYRAQELAARNRAIEELERILAALRDAKRRFTLYETTMIPLAETSYEAVEASYQSGRASVDEILMSERDLLDLQLKALRARADGAKAWAELERVVGRPVSAEPEEKR